MSRSLCGLVLATCPVSGVLLKIPINRHFYVYKPPRPLAEIEADITALEGEIAGLLKGLVA